MSSAKCALNDFYVRNGVNNGLTTSYDRVDEGPWAMFVCSLRCAEVQTQRGVFTEHTFTGKGTSKKVRDLVPLLPLFVSAASGTWPAV